METLADIPVLGTLVTFVLPFLIVLSVVVFIHEFGHYIVGRWSGIKSEVFSIGFGPKLWGRTDRRGTHWQVAALPLGGFVKFTGDMDPASAGQLDDSELPPEDRAQAFHNAPLKARVATVAAGPIFNFILSIILIAILGMTLGKAVDEPRIGGLEGEAATIGFEVGDEVLAVDGVPTETLGDLVGAISSRPHEDLEALIIRGGTEQTIPIRYDTEAVVTSVAYGSPAETAGLEAGDVIETINGAPIASFHALRQVMAGLEGITPMTLEVRRDDERLTTILIPEMKSHKNRETGETVMRPTMGVTGGMQGLSPHRVELGPIGAVVHGVTETWSIIVRTLDYLWQIITGQADASQLGGPIGIAQISGQAFAQGLTSMIWLIAVLSTSIGLINLFPIPILDGGHLMFYSVEALRGRPVGGAAMRVGNMVGLSFVVLLMVFATYNDLLRI